MRLINVPALPLLFSKVQNFSGHSAISSDMIYGNATSAAVPDEDMSLEDGVSKLKDSVKDFFSTNFS